MTYKAKRFAKMKHFTVTIAFLMMFGQGVIGAATARPLEHSPGELAWAAWLQQDSRQSDPQPPPRRITTKSLFVFPNLGPEALPACADGYRPDSMGRCVKVVKVDETAHLEFLLQKLNSQFATETSENQDELYDYDIDTEAPDTSGPFQFNIPIAMQVQAPKPEDSEGSGDAVVVFKKEAPLSVANVPEVRPVSSPEYVPGDVIVDVKPNTFETVKNVSATLPQNSTSETTIFVSSNGNFENLTSNSTNGDSETIQEFQNIKNSTNDDTEIDIKKLLQDAVNAAATSIMKTLLEEVSNHTAPSKNGTLHEAAMLTKDNNSSIPLKRTNNSTSHSNGTNEQSDIYVEQIEALKDTPLSQNNTVVIDISSNVNLTHDVDNKTSNDYEEVVKRHDNEDNPTLTIDLKPNDAPYNDGSLPNVHFDIEKDHEMEPSNPMDIEEKIKVISRFADVTRNTEQNPHIENYDQKKTPNNPEIYPHIPQPQNILNFYTNPIDSEVSPSNIVRFPSGSKAVPNNHISSHEQQLPYEKNRPFKTDFSSSSIRHKPPFWWLPNNWNIEQPKDDQNLMSFWSRMPLVPDYPYGNNPEHNRHPMRYQALYPNPQEASGRINLRHTSINHRRGRLYNRDRQTEHEEPIMYARGRHPHYRE
ncbi:uncharacterized protein LOC143913094 [Arctopsyche grandis]|uniref:uncharacterized protein LOC143913094 n=1 Tax=Arctopsyche grandis TaxID=121162 RepID=UPI00406D663D